MHLVHLVEQRVLCRGEIVELGVQQKQREHAFVNPQDQLIDTLQVLSLEGLQLVKAHEFVRFVEGYIWFVFFRDFFVAFFLLSEKDLGFWLDSQSSANASAKSACVLLLQWFD